MFGDAYPESSLADLYDPLTMPPDLLKAHQALDKAVDRAYRPQPFPSERHRIEFLFSLYEKLTAPLESKEKKIAPAFCTSAICFAYSFYRLVIKEASELAGP